MQKHKDQGRRLLLCAALLSLATSLAALSNTEPDEPEGVFLDTPSFENPHEFKNKDGMERKGKGINAQPVELNPIGDLDVKQEEAIKTFFGIRGGDIELTFGGTGKFETWIAKNPILLNSEIPDAYAFFKQTAEFKVDLVYGKNTFGCNALEFFMNIRQKALWGAPGRYVETVSESVKLSDSIFGRHKHFNDKALIWLKTLWLKLNFNSLFHFPGEFYPMASLQMGFFPFELGRGISLGTIYGLGKDFLGIYTGYQNDTDAPGVDLHLEIIKDILSFDIYYARLEERGDSLSSTFNADKAVLIGRALNPWRGSGKNNDLVAIKGDYSPFDNDELGSLDLEAYGFYNEASDRKIEFDFDSKSQLGTIGFQAEYSYGNFEIGGEIARNFGQQVLRALDRNIVKIAVDPTDGTLFEQYTEVLNPDGSKARVTKANQAKVNKNEVTINESDLSPLMSASDRYRLRYTVHFNGWMSVLDAAYTFKPIDLKFSGAFGYASGDGNPFSPDPTVSGETRQYKGWIGLQEGYVGKRVPSLFVLDARKIRRPISLSVDQATTDIDNSFSDLMFLGAGIKWFPRDHNEDKLLINPNILAYWKVARSRKFDMTTNAPSTTEFASKFIGVETNMAAKYGLFKNLQLFINFAVFFPGKYYKDIKGTPLFDDLFNRLNLPDDTGVEPTRYRISTDMAWLLNIGLFFKF